MKVTIVLAVFLLISAESQAQCAMCRASVSSNLSEGRGAIGTGLNFGILYLLTMPYLLAGGLFLVWYRASRQELARKLSLSQKLKDIYKHKQ